jgi:hypothetical protein
MVEIELHSAVGFLPFFYSILKSLSTFDMPVTGACVVTRTACTSTSRIIEDFDSSQSTVKEKRIYVKIRIP